MILDVRVHLNKLISQSKVHQQHIKRNLSLKQFNGPLHKLDRFSVSYLPPIQGGTFLAKNWQQCQTWKNDSREKERGHSHF